MRDRGSDVLVFLAGINQATPGTPFVFGVITACIKPVVHYKMFIPPVPGTRVPGSTSTIRTTASWYLVPGTMYLVLLGQHYIPFLFPQTTTAN